MMRTRVAAPPTRARKALRHTLAPLLSAAIVMTGVGAAPQAAFAVEVPAASAHYDMTRVGGLLRDTTPNARHATLTGFSDASFVDAAGDAVLRFQRDGYATLPQGAITGTDNEFTVEYTVTSQTGANQFGWVLGDGVGPWNTTTLGNHLFVNPVSAQGGYNQQVLAGIRVKTGSANGEIRLPAGGGLNPGFTTLTMVGSGDTLTLYRDGAVLSTVTHPYALSSIIGSGDVLGYLGRSLYQGDALLVADVLDLKLWDTALTAEQVVASAPSAATRTAATDAILRLDLPARVRGANAGLDAVTTNLTFPATVNGVGVTWSTSNPAVVSDRGVVSRSILEDTDVTIIARTASGADIELDVRVIAPTADSDLDAVALKPRTTENLPLVAEGVRNGSAISWTSSDPALVTETDPDYAAPAVGSADPFRGAGIVTRPAYGEGDVEVQLTATAELNGRTVSRTFDVTVAELGRTAPDAGYAAAYFRSDSDEKIYQAATSGNDFFTFSPVNGGRPAIESTADTTGLRDPYILRSNNGDKYYMIATDLCIGCGTGWGPAQSQGSLKVAVWESTDLVNWERTNGENAAIPINQPAAGMTWAPEAYWDDDLDSYVVHFASRLYSDETRSNSDNLHARMFTVLTRDFTTFSYPPQLWQDTGHARIDSTVEKIGDYYYRFTKNESSGPADGLERGKDVFLERSRVLTAPTTRSDWNADPETTWQLLDTEMSFQETRQVGEGPQIIKLNQGDPNVTAEDDTYVVLIDNFAAGGYRAFVTTGEDIASSRQDDRLSRRADWNVRPIGGLPASPRHGSFVPVSQTVLDALHAWRAVEAVDSTTTLTLDGRTVTATVTAADEGDAVGTVTFAGDGWSDSVSLADGTATTEVPAGVSTVTARYDGYSDGLVSPSESSAVQVSTLDVTARATTRCIARTVHQVVTVRNGADVPVVLHIAAAGQRRAALAAGGAASYTFATRAAQTAASEATVTATAADGSTVTVTATVPAASCR